jgi:ATP-binding cassette, subfamily B, multidrug efflux pump
MNRFFSWLERRVDSFPLEQPQKPPASTWGFIKHYTRPFYPLLVIGFALSVLLGFIEVRLFAYVGSLVDTLGAADRVTFWANNKWELLFYAALALLIQPGFNAIADSIENQGLRGNYAMRIRWLAHRYMLRQSMDFFHNEFAGRVATKVMQAALGVRDMVMKMTQVIAWVVSFLISSIGSFSVVDWRLPIPLLIWLVLYGFTMWYFVPRLGCLKNKRICVRSSLAVSSTLTPTCPQ